MTSSEYSDPLILCGSVFKIVSIAIRKQVALSIPPCGTPVCVVRLFDRVVAYSHFNRSLSKVTEYKVEHSILYIHLIEVIYYGISTVVSKAFSKSKKTPVVVLPSLKSLRMSVVSAAIVSIVVLS